MAILTIDDSPSSVFHEKVHYLASKGVPAIFFCKGANMETHFDDAVRAVQKGFILGNHSYTHPHFSAISIEEGVDQIQKTEALIERVYQAAGVQRSAKFFRFPYGDRGYAATDAPGGHEDEHLNAPERFNDPKYQAFQTYLREQGFRNFSNRQDGEIDVGWTFNTKDWALGTGRFPETNTPEGIIARIDRLLTEGVATDIVLMHDHDYEHPYFSRFIEHFLKCGVTFTKPE